MWPTGWNRPKGKCVKCGKLLALSAPSGEWTNALYPRKHRNKKGDICEGTWMETDITVNEQRCEKEAK